MTGGNIIGNYIELDTSVVEKEETIIRKQSNQEQKFI